jgi:hypothetical protein
MRTVLRVGSVSFFVGFLGFGLLTALNSGMAQTQAPKPAHVQAIESPLAFEPNVGQEPEGVRFAAKGGNYSLQLRERSAVVALPAQEGNTASQIELELLNSNPKAVMTGAGQLQGTANYIPASDKSSWHLGVPRYGRVEYSDVYSGTGLAFYAHRQSLEYDFKLQAGSDPARVRMAIRGADSARIDESGNLALKTGGQEIRFLKPVAYQTETNGVHDLVPVEYVLTAASMEGAQPGSWLLGFRVGSHDATRELVIDPVLSYGEILPSVDNNIGAMTADSSGNTYVAGQNQQRGFYLAKFDPNGNNLFTTVVGSGAATAPPTGIAVDSTGRIFVTGFATSGLPATSNAYLNYTGTHQVAYVAAFPASGAAPTYLSYLGGMKSTDYAAAIATDGKGNFYIAGGASSQDFPTTPGAYLSTNPSPGNYALFAAKFNPSLSGNASLVYSTLSGTANGQSVPSGIAVDSSGNAYLTAWSVLGYPVTSGAFAYNGQYATSFNDGGAFLTKFNPTGTALVYSAFLGPGQPTSVQVDGAGDAYVTGSALADDFPTTSGAYQTSYPGGFVSELNPAGSALIYSTFLSGPSGAFSPSSDSVYPQDIAIPSGCASNCAAYISGYTYTTDFPAINALQSVIGGNPSPFLVGLAGGGATATLSTYLGGLTASVQYPNSTQIPPTPSVALDGAGNIYFAANMSNGTDYPDTVALPTQLSVSYLAKISTGAGSLVVADPSSIDFDYYGVYEVVGVPSSVTSTPTQVVLRNVGSTAATISSIAFSPSTDFSENDTCSGSIPAGGTCTLNIVFTPSAAGKRSATMTVTSNAGNSPVTVALSGTASAEGFLQISPVNGITFADQPVGSMSSPQMFTLTNIGTSVTAISPIAPTPSAIQSTYGNGSDFQVLNDCPANLNAGASCNIGVTFDPLAPGLRGGTIYVSNSGATQPSVPVYGVGVNGSSDGTISLSATTLNFNTQVIGSTSTSQTVTITNTTNAPVSIFSVSIATKGETGTSDFILFSGTCVSTSPVFLRPQQTCSMNVKYAPTVAGSESGTLTVTDSATASPHTVALTGIGLAAAQSLEFSPGNFTFVDQPVGIPSSTQTIYVYNTAAAPVIIDRLLISGDFLINSSNCPGNTLKPGPAPGVDFNFAPDCTVRVQFDPTTTGARTGTLSFVDTAGGTQVLNLAGNGITATGTVLVEPSGIEFPVQAVGTTSAPLHFVINNPGNAVTTINDITTTGDFAIADDCNNYQPPLTFPFTLNSLANCGVDITFTPTSTSNPRTGTVVVQSSGGTSTLTLTGSGVTASTAVGLSPTSLNFGNVQMGVSSFVYNVYLRNTGTTGVTLTTLTGSGDYAVNSGNCGFYGNVLSPGQSCYVQVSLTPTATGTRTGTLSLVDSAGTQTAALTGVGTSTVPAVLLNPGGFAFNQQTVGTTSPAAFLTLVNNGTAALAISTAAITSGGSAYTIVPESDRCSGTSVPAGEACSVEVQFSPTAAGYLTGALTYTDSKHNTYVVALAGYAPAATVSAYVSPTSINFPGQVLTTTSSTQSFQLYNTGNTALTVGTLSGVNTIVGTATTGVFSTNSTQGGYDGCSGTVLAANGHCQVTVSFSPAAVGSAAGSITAPVTYSNNGTGSFLVNLTGLGVAVKDVAELTPTGINFADEAVNAQPGGGADYTQYITLENLGNLPFTVGTLTSTNVVIGATTKGDFTTSGTYGGYDGCTGQTVSPRSYCQIEVAFTPAAAGAKTGSVVFPVTYGDNTTTKLTANFTGKGIADGSTIVVTPTSAQFDSQVVNTTGTNTLTVTVSNTGNQPVKIGQSTLTSYFFFSGDSCSGTTLGVNSYCQIVVTFSPHNATGPITGTLTIPDNAAGNPHKVSLSGTSLPATQQIVLSQSSVNFGSQLVATRSGAVSVFVTNQGSSTVPITSVVLAGTNASDFLESDSCAGGSLSALQYCIITVTFNPAATSTGVRTATVTESDSASGSHVITLMGTGVTAVGNVALYPSSINFGSQALGTKSTPQTVSITNTGAGNLVIKSVVSSNTTEFPITSNQCSGKTLAAGTNCLLTVLFDPNLGSTQTATITVTDNANNVAGSTQTVSLTGLSVGVPQATLKPTSLSFGNEGVGVPSTAQTITLTDSGTDTLVFSSIAVTGTDPGDFTETNTCGKSITATTSCTITVTFNPIAVGARSATLTVTDNAGNVAGTTQTAALSGTGTGVEKISFSPTKLTFGSTNVGASSASQKITVSNPGSAPTTISSIAVSPTGDFTQTNTCTSPLAAGSTCAITVVFTPSAPGARSASIVVTDGAAGSPQSIALAGTGVGVATATLSATTLTFGSQAVGVAGTPQTVKVTNTGSASLVVGSLKVSGTNAGDFKATSTACPGTLAVSASCTISVTFTPGAAGARSATLTVTDNSGNVSGSTQTVALSGTGAGNPKVTITPSTGFAFGSVAVGSAKGPQSVTLSNPGTGPLTVSSIAVTGADAGDYLEFDTCVGTVNIGASCDIALYFLPKAAGARAATVVVTDNANNVTNATQSIAVTGTGTGTPTASLSATTLAFGTVKVGALSGGKSVTLTNTGNAPLTVASVALSGDSSDYIEFNTCSTVASGDTCVLAVFFEPTATGSRPATITFTDDSGGTAGAKQTVTLTGTGN